MMNKLVKDLVVALKGYAMGAANVIPGVSGGTIALLTGIFGRIVDALNSIMDIKTWKMLFKGEWRGFWKAVDGRFLVALMTGTLLSIFTLAKLMEYVLLHYPIRTWAFFFGMIAASAAVMLAKLRNWKWMDGVWVIAGIALGVIICTLSPTTTPDDLWFIFICGAIAICTMILPGISGSFILLILGKYAYIMTAVSEMNIPVLLVFGAGCVIGILAFSKVLHWLLDRFERPTMLVLIGFVLGSLIKVWPWNDTDAIIRSQLLKQGADKEAAEIALSTLTDTGQSLQQLISDYHVNGAIIFGLLGVVLVGILEYLGGKNGSQEA